jgi:hypothetical protein
LTLCCDEKYDLTPTIRQDIKGYVTIVSYNDVMKAKKQVFSQLLQATSSVFRKDNIIIPFVLQDIYPVLKTSFNRFSYVFATLSTFLVYFPYFISKDRFMALHLVVY